MKKVRVHTRISGSESIDATGEVEFECIYEMSQDELRPGIRFTIVEGPHSGIGTVLASCSGSELLNHPLLSAPDGRTTR